MNFFQRQIHNMFFRMLTDKNGLKKSLVNTETKIIDLGLYGLEWTFHSPKNDLGIAGLVRWFDYKVVEQQYKFSCEPSFCEPPEVTRARFVHFINTHPDARKKA